MPFWTINACCRVCNLRTGTFIIAGICMVLEAISLIIHSVVAWAYSQGNQSDGYVYVQKFMVFIFILFNIFKLVLTAALLVGIVKRLPDHLEMWYRGYFLFEIIQTIIAITAVINELQITHVWFWIIITERTIMISIIIYFALIVRSYYYQMCGESNFYTTLGDSKDSKGLKCEKNKCHTYEEVMFNKNAEKEDPEAPKYGFTKNGGVVYSSPRPQPNTLIDIPMPTLEMSENNQTSMLYPALA